MSDYSDLIKRLRDLTDENFGDLDPFSNWGREMVIAADVIEHLMSEIDVLDDAWKRDKDRIAELEAALKHVCGGVISERGNPVDAAVIEGAALRMARKALGMSDD